MTRTQFTLALVAAAALAGCNKADTANEAAANTAANAAPVVLPPSISASKAYRCKDNSLVYIDWLSDGTARIKKTRDEVGTSVTVVDAAAIGNAQSASIKVNGQTCHM